MLESLSSAFAEISLPQLAVIAGMALVASVVGGVAGYGTGALMPLVLVPMVGAEPVVPILSISALLTNASRAAAFWSFVDGRRAHHPALAVDGGGARRRRRGRNRCGHLHRHRARQARHLRACRRGERAGSRDRAAHRRRSLSRRLPGQGADRALIRARPCRH